MHTMTKAVSAFLVHNKNTVLTILVLLILITLTYAYTDNTVI